MLSAPSAEMTSLLKSVLINPTDGTIRWEKLEQFISIASNADAAISGDFQALKKAQDRSDLAKLYAGKQQQANVTFDVTLQIFDFLVSENGRFLFEPLINEIVETIEALGLTAVAITSIATSGLVPPPSEKPKKEKVQMFFKLMGTILDRVDGEGSSAEKDKDKERSELKPYTFDKESGTSGDRNYELSDALRAGNNGERRLSVLRTAFSFLSNMLQFSPTKMAQLQPIVNRSSVLVRAVVSKLLERGTSRVVRSVVSPANVGASLPVLGRVIDLVFKPLISGKK
jgi:hypothetical protein